MKLLVKHPFLLVRGLALCQKKIHRGAIGSSKTTEIYTHVSKKSVAKIKNPLDYIIEQQNNDNERITNIIS